MKNLQESYPEQFNGPYYLGTSVKSGWAAVVERTLDQIRAALPPDVMAGFHWLQIKEKFGELRMYWAIDYQKVVANDTSAASLTDEAVRASLFRQIDGIVEAAEKASQRTCEHCGQPGRLYSNGYWATLCDEHATGRLFPPVYGEWLDARESITIGTLADGISTERVMYFRGVALYSWRSHGAPNGDHVLIEEMPPWLVDLVRSENVVETKLRSQKACSAEDVGHLVSTHADRLRDKTRLVLPDGARIDTEQEIAFWAAKNLGVGRVELEHLVQSRGIVIAGLISPDGSYQVFKQEHGETSVVKTQPAIFLERRAKEFEMMAMTLREMLRALKEFKQ